MGTEYRHAFAVADVDWVPRSEKEFETIEKKIEKVLTKWNLVEALVERRTGEKRTCCMSGRGVIGKWTERPQNMKEGVPESFLQERRIDWKPASGNEKILREIAGRDFEYSEIEKDPEIQWIHWQCGPNYKIFSDPYGLIERTFNSPFLCTECGIKMKVFDEPWVPSMIDGHDICSSICSCGKSVTPASIKLKSKTNEHVPEITFWKSALFIDFGKCHPQTVVWSGRMQSRDFVRDLEGIFDQKLVQFSDWY